MKSNELMIGDLVYCITDKTIIKIGRLNTIDQFIGDTDNYADEEDRLNLLSDVEGIPITREILKKNGFVMDGTSSVNKSNKIEIIHLYKDNLIFSSVTEDGYSISIPHLKYVHELQHTLRLCGYNDLADNFKIE